MFLLDNSDTAMAYTLPFLVGLALPGWRSRIITGIAGLALAAYMNATMDGRLASGFALLFILTAVGGLWCGLLTRVATLWIAPLSRHPYRFMAVAMLGYILPPIAFSGPAATMAWLKRPSQRVCAAATYRVSAADMTLNVRATPLFAFEVGAANSLYTRFLSFDSEYGLKEICGRGLRDNQVIGPVAVGLYPWKFGSSHVQSWAALNCPSARDATLVLVCRLADEAYLPRRMERAAIYGREMDTAMLRRGAYAIEKRLHQQLLETSEPFVLVCDEASSAETTVFCVAREIAASGIRMEFLFRTNGARMKADSDSIRIYLRELIASLSAGVSS